MLKKARFFVIRHEHWRMPGQVNEFPELLREVWRFDGRERRVDNGRVATPSRFFTVVHHVSVARVKFGDDSVIASFFHRRDVSYCFEEKSVTRGRVFIHDVHACVSVCFILDRKSLVGCEVDRVTIASLMEGKCNMMKRDLFNIIFMNIKFEIE